MATVKTRHLRNIPVDISKPCFNPDNVLVGVTISWRQNEFHSVLHSFEDLAHLHLRCVANFIGVQVPKQWNTLCSVNMALMLKN